MAVIDSQIHIWGAETEDRPWAPGAAERLSHHTSLGLLKLPASQALDAAFLVHAMDEVGVDAAILVPHSAEGDGGGNGTALAAAHAYPGRFGVMGRLPLERPDEAMAEMRDWREQEGALGFRLTFSKGSESAKWLTDGSLEWFWPVAEELDLPLMVNLHGQLAELAAVARRFPGLRIALDHFGLHSSDLDDRAVAGVASLCELSDIPNLSVKVSCAPAYTTESYPYPTMQVCIKALVGAFGAERIFWGSDLTRVPATYQETLDLVAKECAFLSDTQRRLVLGDALSGWLNWTPGRAA